MSRSVPPREIRSRIHEIDHSHEFTTEVILPRLPHRVDRNIDRDVRYLDVVADGVRDLQTIIEQKRRLYTDSLTGLGTVYALEDRLGKYIFTAKQRGLPLIVSLVDLDNLKAVNDTVGHSQGNDYLCLAAQAMVSSTRATDEIFRVGGDEFVVIGQIVEGSAEVNQELLQQDFRDRLGTNMQSALQASPLSSFGAEGGGRLFSLSAGQVLWDPSVETFEAAFIRADGAMYEHKKADGV